jgi:hypothetical protein
LRYAWYVIHAEKSGFLRASIGEALVDGFFDNLITGLATLTHPGGEHHIIIPKRETLKCPNFKITAQ